MDVHQPETHGMSQVLIHYHIKMAGFVQKLGKIWKDKIMAASCHVVQTLFSEH
jgi:hypothetical protein